MGSGSKQNSFAFCVHLGKWDFSFAIEYCLISQKAKIVKKRLRKIYPNFSFVASNMFTCDFFSIILRFRSVNFHKVGLFNYIPCFHNVFFLQRKRDMIRRKLFQYISSV